MSQPYDVTWNWRTDQADVTPTVTVAELIEHLKRFPPESVVYLECEDYYYSGFLRLDSVVERTAYLYGARSTLSDRRPGERPNPKTYPPFWTIDEHDSIVLAEAPAVVIEVSG